MENDISIISCFAYDMGDMDMLLRFNEIMARFFDKMRDSVFYFLGGNLRFNGDYAQISSEMQNEIE